MKDILVDERFLGLAHEANSPQPPREPSGFLVRKPSQEREWILNQPCQGHLSALPTHCFQGGRYEW